MARIRAAGDEYAEARRAAKQVTNAAPRPAAPPRFAPAGQSTQMIVGAEPSTDAQILSTTANLYSAYRLKRVYFSAFSPIPDSSARLPSARTSLVREHRLYQSDWLLRFYGYSHEEITAGADDASANGMLDLDVDPKLGWALRNRGYFPVDLNTAAREQLLRVPGLGVKSVNRLLKIRRWQKIRLEDLVALRAGVNKAMPFVVCVNHRPDMGELASERLRARFTPATARQMTLAL